MGDHNYKNNESSVKIEVFDGLQVLAAMYIIETNNL